MLLNKPSSVGHPPWLAPRIGNPVEGVDLRRAAGGHGCLALRPCPPVVVVSLFFILFLFLQVQPWGTPGAKPTRKARPGAPSDLTGAPFLCGSADAGAVARCQRRRTSPVFV
jgi:hypothetical protein